MRPFASKRTDNPRGFLRMKATMASLSLFVVSSVVFGLGLGFDFGLDRAFTDGEFFSVEAWI